MHFMILRAKQLLFLMTLATIDGSISGYYGSVILGCI